MKRCNQAGVRIYVDAVINHMTSDWPKGTGSTANSSFDAAHQMYDAVPFTPDDFHGSTCPTNGNTEDYSNAQQVHIA